MIAHSFQCPACGAPLLPRGNIALISCPYCQTSVVVPEELRQASEVAGWTTLVYDHFTANDNNWLVGSMPSDYFAKLNQVIADGRYRWEALVSRASSMTTAWLTGYTLSDFHLIVNGKHLSGSKTGSSFGVLFRLQDNHNFYSFRLTDSQFFAVAVVTDSQWRQIVDWTRSSAIKPYGVNQLEVIGRDTHFTFLINGQTVSEVDDSQYRQGLVGLAIEGYTVGEEISFDFMDITLRAP
ncbi:MAG: hypothetical protein HC875_32415 [Anaerolineales bacterium]|nr:hypothetical protein [Anaerolineales bacterium]